VQGTAETCRDVLNKITTVSDIKLDIYIGLLFYDTRNHEPKINYNSSEFHDKHDRINVMLIAKK
jgi:hypothetical protein